MSAWRRAKAKWDRISPRTHDVVFILISIGSSIGIGFNERTSTFGAVGAVLIGMLASSALWWRRSNPIGVVVFGSVVAAAINMPVIAAIGLFTLTIRRRDRVLAACAGLFVLGLCAGWAIHDSLAWEDVGGSVFIASQIMIVGAYIGTRRDLITSLRERITRAEAEREIRAEQARVAERTRIAREMHDVLAHKVSLIALHAGGLEVNPSAGPQQVTDSAALIRTTARQALEDLRGVLGVLRSDTSADGADLSPQPTLADLQRLVDSSRAAGIPVELELEVDDLPDALGRTAYRVVQESLTNVHKHARGAATTIVVRGDEAEGVVVDVRNRRPVASDTLLPGSGAGLVGLAERVELLGGSFDSGPDENGGWQVHVWLPWSVSAQAELSGGGTS